MPPDRGPPGGDLKTPTTELRQSIRTDGPPDDETALTVYETLIQTASMLVTGLTEGVINPVAKAQFEADRGHPVTQVLPDQTENYQFESHGFEALVLPDERTVTNAGYDGSAVTETRLVREAGRIQTMIADAERLWTETFGAHDPTDYQPSHPGPFPLSEIATTAVEEAMTQAYNTLLESSSLAVAVRAIENQQFRVLSDLFDVGRDDLLTPGGTDLSAIRGAENVTVGYNDGRIAVVRPTGMTNRRRTRQTGSDGPTPVRGVIVGHDDTPAGIFAHVVDVTNLHPQQTTTHDAIRSAMGFDREIDPEEIPDRLEARPGERIRLQGDLRVEWSPTLDTFADEIKRTERINFYRDRLDTLLESAVLPRRHIRGRGQRQGQDGTGEVSVRQLIDVSVDPNGAVSVNPTVTNTDIILLAYGTALIGLDTGPAAAFSAYSEIPYLSAPNRAFRLAAGDPATAVRQARADLTATLETALADASAAAERAGREAAAAIETGLQTPKQITLPVDNHLAMVADGVAPAVDSEPVPVAVPEETTLYLQHREHTTVTTTIETGVYRFSLLPRGLQPAGERPQWPLS